LKLRSVKSIVIAPAKTGNESNNSTAVIKTDQTNKGSLANDVPSKRILKIVVIKLIAPKMDLTPARCSLKIVKSTEPALWKALLERGGYTVHPVPAPVPTRPPVNKSVKDGGKSQNLMLFIRGKAISGAPIIKGTSQFPKPPIMIGITMKKIMIKA
jgi:hypothetical protein